MSRVIKYRAWSTVNREMWSWEDINLQELLPYVLGENGKECELMQYTNYKDADGVDVYEGDLCRFVDQDEPVLYECKWNPETAGFDFFYKGMAVFKPGMASFLQVRGNIYANPELVA